MKREVDRAMQEKPAVKNDFTKGGIPAVIMKMAIPMTVAQIVSVLYNIVDRMYIGHMQGVGSLALTGLGLCMPIIIIINAFANLCGMGGGPLCSIARGKRDNAYAEELMGNSLTLLLIFGAALTAIITLTLRPMLFTFGASDDTYPFAADYMRIYTLGSIFVMLSLGMHSFINAQGFALISMLTTLLGAGVNIVLDPIFIFVFDMGIKGAAIATVISQAASAAWVMGFLCSSGAALKLKLRDLRLRASTVGRILAMGVSAFCMNATSSLVQIAANVQLRAYGGDLYVGVMTVLNSVQQVFFLVMGGVGQGAQPVIGFNYGAGEYSRVRWAIRFIGKLFVCYSAAVMALALIFPKVFVLIFNNEPALVAAAVRGMRIYFCFYAFMGLQMLGQTTFQGLGRSGKAVFFSLLRKAFIVVPLTFALPALGMGAEGVYWAESISNIIGGCACALAMYFTEYRVLRNEERALGGNA